MDKSQVNVLEIADMATKSSERLIGIKPPDDAYEDVMALCKQEDRAKAWVALQLFMRGWAAWKRDGLIREPLTDQGGKRRKTG